jgi:hypothetical protein
MRSDFNESPRKLLDRPGEIGVSEPPHDLAVHVIYLEKKYKKYGGWWSVYLIG